MKNNSAERNFFELCGPINVAKWFRRVWAGCALVILTISTAHAQVTANDTGFTLDTDGPRATTTVNIHAEGMTSGGFAPVYLNSINLTAGRPVPPGTTVSRVGNTCLSFEWTDNPNFIDSIAIDFTVIAGDGSTSNLANPGRLSLVQGGTNFTVVTDTSVCNDDISNVAPVTTTINTQTVSGTAAMIAPIGTFATDQNDQNGETLRLIDTACGALSPPSNGVVSRSGDTLTYTPNGGFDGADTFEYCVTDKSISFLPLGPTDGVKGTVNVQVNPASAPGVADDPNEQTDINVPIFIDVMANDPIGDAGTLVSATIPVSGGTANVLDANSCPISTANGTGCIEYTPPGPDADGIVFEGVDSFNYTAAETGNLTNTNSATVTVTVVTPPGAPDANADNVTGVVAGVAEEIDVLGNDTGTNLSIINVTVPTSGTAVITPRAGAPDVIIYTPDVTFSGSDSFLYTITDGDQATIDRIARVTISVTGAPLLTELEPIAQNPTQAAVGAAIDVVCPALNDLAASNPNQPLSPGQLQLLDRCNALIESADLGDISDVQTGLQDIAGEEALAQGATGVQVLNTQIKNIGSRIAALRAGARGISAQGLVFNVEGKALPNGVFSSGLRGSGASADEENSADSALLADSKLGIFITGRLNFGDHDQTENEEGFDFDTLGVTIGADYRFTNNLVIGGAVGYSDSEVEFNFDGGDLQSDSITYSVYGTYYSDKFYMDVLAGGGGADFDSRRIMVFADNRGGVDTIALGSTDGDQSLLSVSLGYNFEKNGWLFSPYLSYDSLDAEIDPYSETEGQGWELEFDKQDIKSRVVAGGFRFAYTNSTSFGVIVPHLRLAYQKELEDETRQLSVRFVNDPTGTTFVFSSDPPDDDFYRIGAGLSIVAQNGFSGFVDYEAITGMENITSSTLTVGLRFERRFK